MANPRAYFTITPDLRERAQSAAAAAGISFGEYMRKALADALKADVSSVRLPRTGRPCIKTPANGLNAHSRSE
ncbi:hypothetical protein B0G57_1443 [Trinickia symbiotica]|nr:hypothetical protein B0G57_1443 [Trinickia symbiotica]